MKKYLEDFFRKYEYKKEDSQILLDAYEKIADSDMLGKWNLALELYNEDINCDYDCIINIADEVASRLDLQEYTLELLIFICLSKRAEAICENYGIDSQMFYENMLDFKYKIEECKLVRGIVGTFVPKWYKRFFNFKRYSFGRLQFEIGEFNGNYEKNGITLTPESKVINVHIPRTGTPLDVESCDEAFEKATKFFKAKGECECVFVCGSWILYEENKKILSEKSNVYKFMERFDLIETKIDKDRTHLWRIFDTDEKNPDRLPCDSYIRKAYANHLKAGGKMGISRGVYFVE